MSAVFFAAITKHGNFRESRKSQKKKNLHKILVFLRFISYFLIFISILIDILVFSYSCSLTFLGDKYLRLKSPC